MSFSPSTSPHNESHSLSFSPVPVDIVKKNPHEFSCLIQEPEMHHLIQLKFTQAPQSLTFMRHYHFLSKGIKHLQSDLNRHRGEQNAIFNIMNGNRSYQIAISPIITEYRRMRQRRNQAMETPMTSPTAPPSDLPPDHPLQPSPSDLPQTIQILPIATTPSPFNELEQLVTAYLIKHPPDINNNESTDNSPSPSFKSFEPEQGTRENPIDVDLPP